MPRWVNISLILLLLPLILIPFILIAICIRITSPGPVIHWSTRVGAMNILFKMPKFRTMRIDTPIVPTHLMQEPDKYITPIGRILRLTSLDELPQIGSILKGNMAFVGPRPALSNQDDIVAVATPPGFGALAIVRLSGKNLKPLYRGFTRIFRKTRPPGLG